MPSFNKLTQSIRNISIWQHYADSRLLSDTVSVCEWEKEREISN
jgi:hypothetical protein